MKKLTLTLLVGLCVAAQPIMADTIALNLNSAQQLATGSPTEVQNQNTYNISSIDNSKLSKSLLPSVELNSSYYPNGVQAGYFNLNSSVYSNSFQINQPLFNAEAFSNYMASQKGKNLSHLKLSQAQIKLKEKVDKEYIEILKIQSNITVINQDITTNTETLRISQNLLDQNVIVESDLLDIEYQQETYNAELITQENLLNEAELKLKNTLNISNMSDIQCVGFDVNLPSITTRNLKDDINYAKNQSSELQYLSENLAYQNSIESGKGISALLPQISLTGQYGLLDDTLTAQNGVKWTWSYGVALSYPIFNFGQNIDTYTQSQLKVKNNTIEADNNAKSYVDTIINQYNAILKYEKLVSTYQLQMKSAKQRYLLEFDRYQEGLVTSNDLLQSQTNVSNAERNYKNTQYDLYYAYQVYMNKIYN